MALTARYRSHARAVGLGLASCVAISSGTIAAQNYPAAPEGSEHVVDEARLVDSETVSRINDLCSRLWSDRRVLLVVVTIESLAANAAAELGIEYYAKGLFDSWWAQSDAQRNGLLLLVSRDDRRVRIEMGPSWQEADHEIAKGIVDDHVVPEFRDGRVGRGILAGVRAFDALARKREIPGPQSSWLLRTVILVTFVLLMGTVISLARSQRHGWGWVLIAFVGTSVAFILNWASQARRRRQRTEVPSEGGARGSW